MGAMAPCTWGRKSPMKLGSCLGLAAASTILGSAVLGCGTSSNTETSAGDAGTDAQAPSMAPVADATPGQWVWTSVEGTMCRDGSETGFAVNVASPPSDKLVIFLEGGGACIDSFFCLPFTSPQTFGPSQFSTWKGGATDANSGVFDRTDTNNPVAGWNFVYIPYCTG